jgi:DNA-binding CsgD family transcriptional regulator/PAS domain-containing protein
VPLEAEIQRVACEAVTLEELGRTVLPLLERALDASGADLYRCRVRDRIESVCGSLRSVGDYAEQHLRLDPMHTIMRRTNAWIFHGTRVPEWREYREHPVYQFLMRQDIANYIHIRITSADHHEPGMAGILVARSRRQPDFGERDELLVARVLPALEAAARRSQRLEARLKEGALAASILELDPQPRLALDLEGQLLWASAPAVQLLGVARDEVPEALAAAARRLGALCRQDPRGGAPTAVKLTARGGPGPVRAELRLARAATGEPFVLAELAAPTISPSLAELAGRARLTPAETEVLALVSLGLPDREIARRRFVSLATIHTHVTRVREKLGVRSRLQAALLARGVVPDDDDASSSSQGGCPGSSRTWTRGRAPVASNPQSCGRPAAADPS